MNNKKLAHVDLSFNGFRAADIKIIGKDLIYNIF